MSKALLVIDIQNDFLPGGSLAVPRGDEIIPTANRLLGLKGIFSLKVASQDWHPRDHGSFASRYPGRKPGESIVLNGLPQILWPDHCVQGSSGADFPSSLPVSSFDKIFQKGTDPSMDSYSAFFDNGHKKSTGLGDFLKVKGIKQTYLVGLATDYCVKFSALDSAKLGFDTFLIEDACRGVNLKPADSREAVQAMRAAGVEVLQSSEL